MGGRVAKIAVFVSLTGIACASAPPKPRYWVNVAISGHETPNVMMGETGACWGVMFAHASFSDPVMIECTEGWEVAQCLTTEWRVDVGKRLEKTFHFKDPDTDELLACRTGWVSCYAEGAVEGGGVCYPEEQTGGPALKRNTGAPRLAVRAPKMLLPGTAGPYGARAVFFVEVLGEINERYYCAGLEVIWSDETRSFEESDCDPWDGTQTQGARWSFARGLGIGDHKIRFQLVKAGQVIDVEDVVVTVSGGEN